MAAPSALSEECLERLIENVGAMCFGDQESAEPSPPREEDQGDAGTTYVAAPAAHPPPMSQEILDFHKQVWRRGSEMQSIEVTTAQPSFDDIPPFPEAYTELEESPTATTPHAATPPTIPLVASTLCSQGDGESREVKCKGNKTFIIHSRPPCTHNMWSLQRWLNDHMCVRLKCFACKAKWHTQLTAHSKCSEFYSGKCKGECGNPHIYARGIRPEQIEIDVDGNVASYQVASLRKQKKAKGRASSLPQDGIAAGGGGGGGGGGGAGTTGFTPRTPIGGGESHPPHATP